MPDIFTILIIAAITTVAIFLALFIMFRSEDTVSVNETRNGSLSDLRDVMGLLLNKTEPWDTLVVRLAGNEGFFQFSVGGGFVELDYPQITDRQKQLRPRVEGIFREMRLLFRVTDNGPDEFLDCDLKGHREDINRVRKAFVPGA